LKNNVHNSPIAVFLPKGINAISAFIGILYSGNYYVPLDVSSPIDRINSIIKDLGDCLIISSTEYKNKTLDSNISNIIYIDCLDNNHREDYNDIIDLDPAYIIFTSGSTGKPKGVVVSQRGVIDYIKWAIETYDVTDKENICSQAPLYFDNSTLDLYLMMFSGASLHIVPEIFYSFPVKLLDYIIQKDINFVFWVPSVLVNISKLNLLERVKLICLKKILFAGEVMPTPHYNYWKTHLPDSLYSNLYGPTEITVDCTYYIVDRVFSNHEPLPIGKQCENTNVLIINEENKLCKIREKGELCVRGSSLALGYWNCREKTNSVFLQNPLHNNYNDLIYKTGDIVYLNEYDEIIFVGRKDNQIKHMGYRIELGEIENAIISYNKVENVCVIYDEQSSNIIAFVETNYEIDLKTLNNHILKFIPKYMIPHKYIMINELPKNNNNKIDRQVLKRELCGFSK
jgi:amino acid adenylation domain-containing protein